MSKRTSKERRTFADEKVSKPNDAVLTKETSSDVGITNTTFKGGLSVRTDGFRVVDEEFSGDWDQYKKIYRDPAVQSAWSRRRDRLIATNSIVTIEGDIPESKANEIREHLNAQLEYLGGGLRAALRGLLNAIIEGYKVAELVWCFEEGKWWIDRIVVKPNRTFGFTADGGLVYQKDLSSPAVIMEERYKFLVLSYGVGDSDRRGEGLGESLYYAVKTKQRNILAWSVNNDKRGTPTITAQVPSGTSDAVKEAVKDKLTKIQNQTVLVYEDGLELGTLDSAADRSGATFQASGLFLVLAY